MKPYAKTKREQEAYLFGQRTANALISTGLGDDETQKARWSKIERQFIEWSFAEYHPELVP